MVRTLIAVGVAVFFVEGRYLASLGAFALYVFTTRLLEASLATHIARQDDLGPKRELKPNEFWALDKDQQPTLVQKPKDPNDNRNKPEHLS